KPAPVSRGIVSACGRNAACAVIERCLKARIDAGFRAPSALDILTMAFSANPEAKPCNGVARPWRLWIRRLFVILVVYPALNGLLPWALSLLTPRYGWTENSPAGANLVGLLPALGAAALFVWVVALKLRPRRPASPLPLLTSGPYAVSRNPL